MAFMADEAERASGPADVGGLEIGGQQASEEASTDIHPGMMTPTKEAPGALFTYMVLPIAGFATRGDDLIVMLDGAPEGLVEVRFACSNWFRTNLYNGAEIPALPFAVSC